jgi:UDP:flavonoid glycosyltransferase YjiC (YdhE family)
MGREPKALIYYADDAPATEALNHALTSLGWRCLWFGGKDGALGKVYKFSRPIDIGRLIHDTDIVISRGGHGLSALALRVGRPHFSIPDHLESALLTYQLSRQQLAFGLPPNLFGNYGANALDRVLNDQLIGKALSTIQRKYAGYNDDVAIRSIITAISKL